MSRAEEYSMGDTSAPWPEREDAAAASLSWRERLRCFGRGLLVGLTGPAAWCVPVAEIVAPQAPESYDWDAGLVALVENQLPPFNNK